MAGEQFGSAEVPWVRCARESAKKIGAGCRDSGCSGLVLLMTDCGTAGNVERLKRMIEEELLFDQYFDTAVRKLMARYGPPREDIEDALSKAVAVAVRRSKSLGFKTVDDLRGYLWRVAENALRRVRRTATSRYESFNEDHAELLMGGDEVEPYPVQESFVRWLLDIVDRWPTETQRTAARLKIEATWEGLALSFSELAELMSDALDREISPGDAGTHWRRAAEKLAQEVQKELDMEGDQ